MTKRGCDRYTSRQVHRHMTAGRVHDKKIDVEIDDKEGGAIDTQTEKYKDKDI